ncbi:MAG TPA: phage holin family protein [Solirubrobacterales bacterium]|jgi:uncharacterized membrane protein YqjE|nr:phage holin family protein [Solirubrobacterales bacterium]
MDPNNNSGLGSSIGDIIDRLTTLIHEEIELAKAEMASALQNLLRGSVAAILGGVFAIFGLFVLLIGLAFFINDLFGFEEYIWPGFFIVAAAFFVFGGLAAIFALKKIKKGSHLAPSQAIAEARKTQEALKEADEPIQQFEGIAVEETTADPSVADATTAAASSAEDDA